MSSLPLKEPQVKISDSGKQATLILPKPEDGVVYTVEDILRILNQKNITYGIYQEAIERMIKRGIYDREMVVAEGKAPQDGEDGYYSFDFNDKLDKKPKINKDGTVDYWSLHAVEIVNVGQVIATYTPPTLGKDGVSVMGTPIPAKKGRPQPPLTGRGFECSEDGTVYTATIDGKIERQNNRIMILSVYEIQGNVGLHTGNINFRGDVIVHGKVAVGAVIQATGSITVDDVAEACTLIAGKDIVLRGGLLGAYKAVLKAKGNITARFFEYATVEAEGDINATSSLCSNIKCFSKVTFMGKHGGIVGGYVYGAQGVETISAGNQIEVETEIEAGVSRELMSNFLAAEKKMKDDRDTIEKINKGLTQFEEFAREHNIDIRSDERRLALMRTKISKQAELAKSTEHFKYLEAIVDDARRSTVRVIQTVFPSVTVLVDAYKVKMKDETQSVEFRERNGKVIMYSLLG